ncbi:MAG: hypothetical protein ABR574_01885 [Cryomorphaceae bacterium]
MIAFVFWCVLYSVSSVDAQEYQSAAGLRASYGGLVTYKQQVHQNLYTEGILGVRWGGAKITGLLEWHFPAFGTDNFYWYGGGGMHLGYHYRRNRINAKPPDGANRQFNLGLDAIGGLEYAFSPFPVLVSLSYKPGFDFTGRRWFVGEGIALSALVYW